MQDLNIEFAYHRRIGASDIYFNIRWHAKHNKPCTMSGGYENLQAARPQRTNNGSTWTSFCNFMKNVKIYKIIIIILVVLFVLPLVAHYYISNVRPIEPDITCAIVLNVHVLIF